MVGVESLEQLWNYIDQPIRVSVGNAKINVVPRRNGDQRLLHLVNMVPAAEYEDFTVTLSRQFAGAVGAAKLHAPNRESAALTCSDTSRFIEISVPCLKKWGIITLHDEGEHRE